MEGRQAMSRTTKTKKHTGVLCYELPPDKQLEIRQKAQDTNSKKRRRRKAAREILQDLFISDSTDKDIAAIVEGKDIEGTELATLIYKMMKKAGNSAQMADILFRLSGDIESQAPQQNITIVNAMTDEQLAAERAKILGSNNMIDITPEPPKIE
jgi:hypothetical protein